MVLMPVGASRKLRWGCLSLAAVIAILAVATEPADARKRKRSSVKQAKAASSYNPPYAAIVVDAKTGAVLHQSTPDGARHPASLTKIMTLYMLFEQLEAGKIALDTQMPVSEEAASQAPTKLGLRPGSTLMVDDAIKGLVTKSANDAAVVIAEQLGGSEEEFARIMTRKARAIGMQNTVYRNASGLPNDQQITTARDQALLGIAVQQRFPKYYKYFSISSFVYHGKGIRNHNKLLGKVEGVDGIKTGYTNASGFNLVTSVKRGYRHVVAVVLGGRSGASRDARMRDLISSYIADASAKPGPAPAMALAAETPPPAATPMLPGLPALFAPLVKPETAKPEIAKHEPTPSAAPAAPSLASAQSTPVTLAPRPQEPAAQESTAAIAGASDAPIKPIKVKTLAVKLVPAKNAPAADATPDPAMAKSVRTAALASPAELNIAPPAAAAKAPETVVAPVTARGSVVPKQQLASAKPDDVAIPSRPANTRGGWAIQVGAFEDEGEAKGKLSAAKGKVTSLVAKAEAYIERTVKGAKTYYRARFAGFDRDQAQSACKQLKRSDMECMAMKM
ncbi:MAG: serine hydrolase [Xanthobacteraceae bacterium]|nr:serine hydrolase [Xanthobacteraceae bacterium]